MKRVIIGALVGAIIYFGFQTAMWVGGFHKDFYTYAPKQDSVLACLNRNLPAEGMYMMPMADQNSPDFKERQKEIEKSMTGNPWAMVFFHPKMDEISARVFVLGILYALIGAFVTGFVMYMGKFPCFWSRFTVSMLFAVFGILHGALCYMNWWEFPWGFVKTQVIDLGVGWALCSAWLGWFVRPRQTE